MSRVDLPLKQNSIITAEKQKYGKSLFARLPGSSIPSPPNSRGRRSSDIRRRSCRSPSKDRSRWCTGAPELRTKSRQQNAAGDPASRRAVFSFRSEAQASGGSAACCTKAPSPRPEPTRLRGRAAERRPGTSQPRPPCFSKADRHLLQRSTRTRQGRPVSLLQTRLAPLTQVATASISTPDSKKPTVGRLGSHGTLIEVAAASISSQDSKNPGRFQPRLEEPTVGRLASHGTLIEVAAASISSQDSKNPARFQPRLEEPTVGRLASHGPLIEVAAASISSQDSKNPGRFQPRLEEPHGRQTRLARHTN